MGGHVWTWTLVGRGPLGPEESGRHRSLLNRARSAQLQHPASQLAPRSPRALCTPLELRALQTPAPAQVVASPTPSQGNMPKVCKFWQSGNCNRGSNCRFFHPGGDDDLSSAFSGCAVSDSNGRRSSNNRNRSYPLHVYCAGFGDMCGEIPFGGDCPSGCSLHWTRVICDYKHCKADITNDFDPYVWKCPACGWDLHGGITRCGGTKVH